MCIYIYKQDHFDPKIILKSNIVINVVLLIDSQYCCKGSIHPEILKGEVPEYKQCGKSIGWLKNVSSSSYCPTLHPTFMQFGLQNILLQLHNANKFSALCAVAIMDDSFLQLFVASPRGAVCAVLRLNPLPLQWCRCTDMRSSPPPSSVSLDCQQRSLNQAQEDFH